MDIVFVLSILAKVPHLIDKIMHRHTLFVIVNTTNKLLIQTCMNW